MSPDEAEIRDRAETREETEHQDNAGSRDEAERPAPLRQRVAADIDRRLLRYRDRFGDFEITHGRVANETERFDAGREMAANGWRGDAGAWVTDPDRELEMLTVWFEGTASGSVFDVGDDEIEEGRWFDEPPDAVADVVAPRVAAWSSE